MLLCNRCHEKPITTENAKFCDECRRLCSKCRTQRRGQRSAYCNDCHAAYMRETRPKYAELSEEAKMKGRCRSFAQTYLRRGKIERKGCEVCGERAQMHHDDYSKPLEIRWLCRRHHVYHHHPIVNPRS